MQPVSSPRQPIVEVNTPVKSPRTEAYHQQEASLINTGYYGKRAIDAAEYADAMEFVKPQNATVKHIFDKYQLDPMTSTPDRNTAENIYLVDDDNNLLFREISRIADTATPIVNIEIYKTLDDILTDLAQLAASENVTRVNPVHVIKSLMRTGYFPVVDKYLDYYSIYQGYDFDLETAKIELNKEC